MPDERMELMCDYMTWVGKERQAKCDQAHNMGHCTQQPTLAPHQMDSLVRMFINIAKSRKQLYGSISFTQQDWFTVRHAFNLRFGGKTKTSVLECAKRRGRYKYVIALFRERCKAAKEEQPDLGEEYWHWIRV